MFQTLDHFLKSWEFEADATQKLLNHLTDESLKQEITSQHWTLGRIAWHTVAAIHIITSNTDLTFHAPAEDFPVPASARFIAESYHQASNAFVQALKTQWTDDTHSRMCQLYWSAIAKWFTFDVFNSTSKPSSRTNDCPYETSGFTCSGYLWSGKRGMDNIWFGSSEIGCCCRARMNR